MGYSFGKAWRNVVGKKAGHALREAVMGRALGSINGSGLYTGSGLYSGNGKYKRKTKGKKRTYRRKATKSYGSRKKTYRKKTYGNNLIAGSGGRRNPSFTRISNETGDIIITHKEYLGDIFGPTNTFNNQVYQLNPGLEQTFPWLSQIAPNYEEYEFNQLVFSYRSVTTDVGSSTTGQCGTIVMATNYNPDAKPFYDKGQMLEYAHAMSCKTTESMEHGVECDPKKSALSNRLFVRSGPPTGTEDMKDYDTGKFQLAIANAPTAYANLPIGELWVYYKVRLSKPKLFTGRGGAISRYFACGARASQGGGIPAQNIMDGQKYFVNQQNNLPISFSKPNSTSVKFTFPANRGGAFKALMVITPIANVANAPLGAPTVAYTGNVVGLKDMMGVTGYPTEVYYSTATPIGNGEEVSTEVHFFVTQAQSGVDNSIIFSANGATTSTAFTTINIEEYNAFGIEQPVNGVYQEPLMVDIKTNTVYTISTI